MKIDDCKKCKFHVAYINGQVMCKYWMNIDSQATMVKSGEVFVLACPKEENKRG
mgnify:CR=1 FL=1